MTRRQRLVARARQFAFQATVMGLAVYFWLLTSPLVWAASKKKVEAAPVETKSYTMPYLIVIMVISMGLMTICRPSRRLDKPDDKHRKDEAAD